MRRVRKVDWWAVTSTELCDVRIDKLPPLMPDEE